MFNLLATILSRSGGQRLLVLIFHRVLDQPDPLRTKIGDAAVFNWQMELLRRHFNVLPLGEAIDLMSRNSLPARAACVTFDDGYADNVTVALPLLQRHGLPATFFIATGFLDGGMMWNDSIIEAFRVADGDRLDLVDLGFDAYSIGTNAERRAAAFAVLNELKYRTPADRQSLTEAIVERVGQDLPKDLMMNSEDVQTLARAGMELGAHTVHHPILESLTTAGGASGDHRRQGAPGRTGRAAGHIVCVSQRCSRERL